MRRSIVVMVLIGVISMFATAAGAQDIKERMKNRLPVINELKKNGVVGENNKGFLEFIGGKTEKADVVTAENADRQEVYGAIARQQGANPDLVGKRRAVQLRDIALSGEWLQDDAGKWYQK